MTKTEYYKLNKPGAADPIRVAGFNANVDAIDAALGSIAASVGAKGIAVLPLVLMSE